MLDPDDTNISHDHDLPSHVMAFFLISLMCVIFLLSKFVKQLTVDKVLTTHSDPIPSCVKASWIDVSYRDSLRKIRFIKGFKSKTCVKNINDNLKKRKGPHEFKKQLKSLLTNKRKHKKPGKVEEYLVHPSDIKAILTEDKVNLIKSVQNFLEQVVGKPISTLLLSSNESYFGNYLELCDLFHKASNEKENIGSQTNIYHKGKVVTWSSDLEDQFRKVLGTNKTTVSEESSTPTLQNPIVGHIDLIGNSEVSQAKYSPKSLTTLFSKSSITPPTSMTSLEQEFEKIPSIRHFQVTLKKFQEESSTATDSTCPPPVGKDKSSQPRRDKSSNVADVKTSQVKEHLTFLGIDKVSKIPVPIDSKNVSNATTHVPTKSPLPLDKSTKVFNAGDALVGQLDISSSTVLFDDFYSDVQFTDSYVSIGFDAGDLSQVPSWHCWNASQ